jgi:hypothetical protein
LWSLLLDAKAVPYAADDCLDKLIEDTRTTKTSTNVVQRQLPGYDYSPATLNRNLFVPAVSLIIPAYNEEDRFESVLTAALNSTDSKLLEVIVVNDCSKDGTLQVAKRVAEGDHRCS